LFIVLINFFSVDLVRQALLIIFLLAIFQLLEIKTQPYFNEELNEYAAFSLNVLIWTIGLKLFATVINDDNFYLMTTIMIICLNCCLYLIFLFKILILKKEKINNLIFSITRKYTLFSKLLFYDVFRGEKTEEESTNTNFKFRFKKAKTFLKVFLIYKIVILYLDIDFRKFMKKNTF